MNSSVMIAATSQRYYYTVLTRCHLLVRIVAVVPL